MAALFVYLVSAHFLRFIFIGLSHNYFLSENAYQKKIDDLTAKNLYYSQQLAKMRGIVTENESLKKTLDFTQRESIRLFPVRVIGIAPSQFRRILFVENGERGALSPDMFVIDDNANLVGKIFRTHRGFCEVILINDPEFAATVQIKGSLGLLKGTLGGDVKVLYIEGKEEVAEGDELWAIPYAIEAQFAVGTVKKIQDTGSSLFLDISVEPYSRPYSARTLYAVK